MAGSKRSAPSDDDNDASPMVKAARSSKKFDLQKRCMFDEDWTQIEDINEHINTHYNMDVQFATSAPPRSRTRKAAKEVSQRLNKMQQIWDEARDRILAEEQGLYRAIDTFRQANRARKHWYLSGNILELPRDEIIKSVSAQKLPDAATLADYLQRILQQEAQRLRTNELIELDDVTFGFDHARKMLWLADTLHDLPGGERLALRVIVSYVTELLLSTALCTSAYVTVHDRLQHRLSQRIHLRGDKSKRGAKTRPFLDLAGAASQLLAVYLTTDYDDPNHEDSLCVYNEHGGRECFHTGSRPILKSLLQSAYGEVRSKVMLTIGTLLPAELADEVVGWALVAEGLPSRPQEYVATDVLTDFGLLNICPVMENIIEKRRRALLET